MFGSKCLVSEDGSRIPIPPVLGFELFVLGRLASLLKYIPSENVLLEG